MISYQIEPKSRKDLRELAYRFRQLFHLENVLCFPIVEILDILVENCDCFSYEIVEDSELPSQTHADTDVLSGHIRIKQSVFDGACNGEGRDRMTIAHEIGHFFTICICGFKFERNFSRSLPSFRDPEWQAKCFAGELLAPAHLIGGMNHFEIAEQCGISIDAAYVQFQHQQKEG